MPKSLLASQAKKRKKKTRQDPIKRQQEREQDRLRHQLDSHRLPCPDSEKRNSTRRERDVAAHRQFCEENPEGSHIEQQ